MGVLTLVVLAVTLFPAATMSYFVEPASKALVDQAGYIGAIMEVECNVGLGAHRFRLLGCYRMAPLRHSVVFHALVPLSGAIGLQEGSDQDEIFCQATLSRRTVLTSPFLRTGPTGDPEGHGALQRPCRNALGLAPTS